MFTFYCVETHDKKAQREMIDREMTKFLKRGGRIEICPKPTASLIMKRNKAKLDRADKKKRPTPPDQVYGLPRGAA